VAELNVNPADLVRVADAYNELAARAAQISPQAAVEVQRIAETHGPIGYPTAVGIAAGLAAREGPLQAKVADFTTYAQRFTEHAATYTDEDTQGAGRIRSVDFPTDFPHTPGGAEDTPPGGGAVQLDSRWKPGDKRHWPYIAGPSGMGPPQYPDTPPWIEVGPSSGNFVRSDELPGIKVQTPGTLGPPPVSDDHGNLVPFTELGPNTGVWVPKSDLPGAVILPPGSKELPPYGYDEYLPGSGIFMWHGDFVPEQVSPPPQTIPQGH
jgi:Excreted virulence factor EspC, type VII ESX diderm